jgi:hypothetical protein
VYLSAHPAVQFGRIKIPAAKAKVTRHFSATRHAFDRFRVNSKKVRCFLRSYWTLHLAHSTLFDQTSRLGGVDTRFMLCAHFHSLNSEQQKLSTVRGCTVAIAFLAVCLTKSNVTADISAPPQLALHCGSLAAKSR